MNENHALLRDVTSEGIERVRLIGKQNGALGGKLIGGGGNGGAVILLCWKDEASKMRTALKQSNFASYAISFSSVGAGIE